MSAQAAIAAAESTLPRLLFDWEKRKPDAIAMREKDRGIWQPITWKDYARNVRLTALGLMKLGVQRGDRVSIASEDTPEWLFADLGCQSLGGISFGIYPTNPAAEVHYALRHSKAKVVVCGDQEQVDKVIAAKAMGGLDDLEKIVCVDMKGMRHYADPQLMSFEDLITLGKQATEVERTTLEAAIVAGDPDDTAIIIYTSGTTGLPKGAMISHRGLIFTTVSQKQRMVPDFDDLHIVCYLPLCHVAERSLSAVMHLVTGSILYFAESVDTVAANLREIAPNYFLAVPRIWEKLRQNVLIRLKDATRIERFVVERCVAIGRPLAERRLTKGRRSIGDRLLYAILWVLCFRSLQRYLGLDRLRFAMCGGATVSTEVLLFFWTIGVPVYQIYGSTELSGIAHSQSSENARLGWSGAALPGIESKVMADGELLVRGPSVFNGYLFDEATTKRTIADGWLHTGDIVEMDEAGSIKVVDRKKDIIITSGGKNITPSLLENAMKDSIYVREAILIGEGRNFLSALIQIDFETVGKWAQERGLAYTTYKSLATNQAVRELVAGEIAEVNKQFARVENIRKFVILSKELDHDDGEVTATLKVRRSIIETKFATELTEIYGGV